MHVSHSLMLILLISTAMMICLRRSRALYNCNNRFSSRPPPIHRCYSHSPYAARNIVFPCGTSGSSLNLKKRRTWGLVRNNLRPVPLILPYRSRSSDTKRDDMENGDGMLCAAHTKSNANMEEEEIIPNGMLLERIGPPSPNKFLWNEHRGAFSRIDKGMGKYW